MLEHVSWNYKNSLVDYRSAIHIQSPNKEGRTLCGVPIPWGLISVDVSRDAVTCESCSMIACNRTRKSTIR